MQSGNRRHVIVVGQIIDGKIYGGLIKDWFSYQWCEGYPIHWRIVRANHEFHVVSNNENFSIEQAASLADAALAGQIFIVDLRENPLISYGLENGG